MINLRPPLRRVLRQRLGFRMRFFLKGFFYEFDYRGDLIVDISLVLLMEMPVNDVLTSRRVFGGVHRGASRHVASNFQLVSSGIIP